MAQYHQAFFGSPAPAEIVLDRGNDGVVRSRKVKNQFCAKGYCHNHPLEGNPRQIGACFGLERPTKDQSGAQDLQYGVTAA
jgi:hypothetical protein